MLPKNYDAKTIEDRIYKFWEETGFFNPDNLPGDREKRFSLLLPPPNVTGSLHMGHALNAIIQDTIIREKRMQGYKTLWLPGTDHAGIATQNVVEKKLKKQGKTRFDLGRDNFIKEVWEWKKEYGNIIMGQLRKLGTSCDWSRQAFTMEENYADAVKSALLHYWEKGWLYRGERPINWCPRCQTSLSDLELEHKEKQGFLWYIKYKIVETNEYLTVATTRPETMFGDTAIAVNPNDEKYKQLVEKKVIVPIIGREIPVIADELVDPKFGTGAVKVTPAHDLKDYEIGLRHNLEMIKVIDEQARMISPAPKQYQGLKVLEAREKIIEELKGLIQKQEEYVNAVPKCYRCGQTIEIIPSQQWFLKMDELAKIAKQAVLSGKIKFYPKNFEKLYFNWLDNIRDWCISRQIWWGHRLPIWQCQSKKDEYFVSLEEPKQCPICSNCQPKQVEDVLDTWFSSALWPIATLGWPKSCQKDNPCLAKENSDLDNFYPSNILTTARDILNLWVSRMIFSGLEFMGKEPFPKVFIHPTVLNKSGQRMSKSLGTGIDPIELIEKYGADAVRFGLAWQITGCQDIKFDEQNIVAGKKFCNKIWNASRFVLGRIPENIIPKINLKTKADKKIFEALSEVIESIENNIDNFKFGQAIQSLYHFFWHQFCDIYLEEAKKQLEKPELKEETEQNLIFLLLSSLKLIHIFMPFISEEIYQKLPIDKKQSLMIEDWPKL